jgi:hypothetical protein
MKVEKMLFGQAIRFIDVVREDTKDFSLFEMTRAIQARYGFLEAPTKLADYNYDTGVTYLVGRFDRKFIKRFQIYRLGLLCEVEASTDVCDAFLDDIIGWLERDFTQVGREKPLTRGYQSNLEVSSEINLGDAFAEIDTVGRMLQETIKLYSPESPQFELSSIRMQTAPSADPKIIVPSAFVFERRADKLFSDNVYFSSAPLTTPDHLKTLDQLERIFAKR